MKQVVVVTNPELGWDCIVGVFPTSMMAELKETFHPPYIIRKRNIETDLSDWE